jgi:hypothetical protein
MSAEDRTVRAQSSGDQEQSQQQQLQVQVGRDVDYEYRDFFSLFVGAEDVVVEFGNRHRSQTNRATVGNRIVLSVPNAYRLQQALGRSLEEARRRFQEQRQAREAEGENQ